MYFADILCDLFPGRVGAQTAHRDDTVGERYPLSVLQSDHLPLRVEADHPALLVARPEGLGERNGRPRYPG